MPYTQKHFWKVEVLNPVDNTIIQTSNHPTINDIFNNYNTINLATWRNIAMGRSKIYNKFIKVYKVPKTELTEKFENEEPPQPIVVSFD